MAIGKDGSIYVEADDSSTLSLERLTSDGSLDPLFGTGGVVQDSFDQVYSGFTGSAVAVQADGRVVVAGSGGNVNGSFYSGIIAARFTSRGAVDKTFGRSGTTGVTLTDDTGGDPEFFHQNANATAVGIAVQRDGKLVIGGYVFQIGLDLHNDVGPARFAAVRLTANGRPDASFGTGGKVQLGTGNLWPTVDNFPAGVALAPDGSVVLAGVVENSNTPDVTSEGFGLVRLTPRGQLDERFGYQGRVGPFPTAPPAETAAIQPDGKTILATAHSLARLNADGSLDTSFGNRGIVLDPNDFVDDNSRDISRYAASILVLPRGDILVAYGVTTQAQSNNPQTFTEIRRFHSDGSPESSTGSRRLAVPEGHKGFSSATFDAMAFEPDGKIVLVSTATDTNTVIVTRYSGAGVPDRSFGTNGATSLSPFGATSVTFSHIGFDSFSGGIVLGGIGQVASAADPIRQQSELVMTFLNSHGKIDTSAGHTFDLPRALVGAGSLQDMLVTAGGAIYVLTSDANGLALSRYLFGGYLDTTLGTNGTVRPAVPADYTRSSPFFIQPDGAIVGLATSTSTQAMIRFSVSGALDTNFGNQGIATLPHGAPTQVVTRASDGTLVLTDLFSPFNGSGNEIVRLQG